MKNKTNRRRYQGLTIQLKYATLLTVIAAFSSLTMLFIMAWFIQRNYNLFLGDELGVSAQVIEIVRHEQRILEFSLFFLFLFSITAVFGASLYITRRLTGPVVSLYRQLALYAEGDWSREFKLRSSDEFREFEAVMNELRRKQVPLRK